MGHIPGLRSDPGSDGCSVVGLDKVLLKVKFFERRYLFIFVLQTSTESYDPIKSVSGGKER